MRLIDADALVDTLSVDPIGCAGCPEPEFMDELIDILDTAPTVEPTGDLISREDAIKAVTIAALDDRDEIEALKALPSAEAKPTVIQSKTLFPTKDFMEWAKRIKEVNPNAVVIPCDAEVASAEAEPSLKAIKRQIDEHWYLDPPSAEAVQEWIPCSERLPLVSGEFLVTLVDSDGTWVSTAQWNTTFGGRWQDIFPNDGYRDISNVIAWKTLPIPYTKGDNDEE